MLKETALAEVHRKLGGKMVDFSGWSMPVNYGSQIDEHHAVRRSAGMFDVSHMTVVDVCGEDATNFLQRLLANDVARLTTIGKALYSAMLNETGGVVDDLIVYLTDFGYRLVVNCGTREKDLQWLRLHAERFEVGLQVRDDLAMIAVQGPDALTKVSHLLSGGAGQHLVELSAFQGFEVQMNQTDWFIARTGYTGEDGCEVMLPVEQAIDFWGALVEQGVQPCGLGARDTLRLEAGLNLYGHEMDDTVSPLEANMAWTVAWKPERSFIGREALVDELNLGVGQKLVGLLMRSRGVLRQGYTVHIAESEFEGVVTSGTFSPTLGVSVALARVPSVATNSAQVMVRGKAVDVEITRPCFVRNGKPQVQI